MTSYQFRVILGLSISSHCRPNNFESLYQFRVIVSISSYCINFESLYQFRFIVSISSYCINFESLYQFRYTFFHILDLKNGLDVVYLLVEPP